MKPSREISARWVAMGLAVWLALANLLVWLGYAVGWWPVTVGLLVSIALLPGLALLRALRIVVRFGSVGVLYSFGLSLLVLMLSGLAANELLPLVGVVRPLELPGVLGAWDVVTALIIAASLLVNRQPIRLRRWPLQGFSKPAWLLLALSLLLPVVAMMGAFRLNNGGDALLAELTLGYAAALVVYVFVLRRHLPSELLAWLTFVIGLTILLMTSLRGWDIAGHDIEREFRVYTLTQLHARWDIGLDRDPYNACLSITILPQMLAKLLNVSGLMVFKVLLQIAFAACPAVIYMLLRRYLSKLGALAGALLFICYPTFINDSAMLTRQGVAYLFFALALLVISNKAQKKRHKLLFVLCGLGAVLSHYSTAYMFVALFAAAAVCKLGLSWWQRRRGRASPRPPSTVLSPLFAGLLFLMTFIWYTQLTATSGGLATTLRSSLANIPRVFSSDNKSSDTSTALLFASTKSQADLYDSYLTASQARAPATPSASQYFPTLISDDLPLTPLGRRVRAVGLDPALMVVLRANFAKVLQVLALAGVLYATYRWLRRRPHALEPDFVCLSLAGLGLLALMVVLPVLSVNYGILRAFQQALIFLIVPIMLLLARLGRYVWSWLRTILATLSVVALFLLFTGFLAQILGGSSPTLSLDNAGLYYGLYYSSAADAQSLAWLEQHVPASGDVRAANINRALMHDPSYPFTGTGILPSQTNAGSFVYLDPAQVLGHKLYTYYDSSPLVMTFPLEYYAATKNQIYSTTSTRVYR